MFRPRLAFVILAIWLSTLLAASAEPLLGHALDRPVSLEVGDTPRRDLLRMLAAQAGLHVLVGPGVTGTASLRCRDLPLREALGQVLGEGISAWTAGSFLVVGDPQAALPPEMLGCSPEVPVLVRQEFLLEHAPAARVVELLQVDFRHVRFVPHPTMNGFYAIGDAEDLRALRNRLSELDVESVPAPEVSEELALPGGADETGEFLKLVESLFPGLHLEPISRGVILRGPPDQVEQVKALLRDVAPPPASPAPDSQP